MRPDLLPSEVQNRNSLKTASCRPCRLVEKTPGAAAGGPKDGREEQTLLEALLRQLSRHQLLQSETPPVGQALPPPAGMTSRTLCLLLTRTVVLCHQELTAVRSTSLQNQVLRLTPRHETVQQHPACQDLRNPLLSGRCPHNLQL